MTGMVSSNDLQFNRQTDPQSVLANKEFLKNRFQEELYLKENLKADFPFL